MMPQSKLELEIRAAMWKPNRVQAIILLPHAFSILQVDQDTVIEHLNKLPVILDTAKLEDGGLIMTYVGRYHERVKTQVVATLKVLIKT